MYNISKEQKVLKGGNFMKRTRNMIIKETDDSRELALYAFNNWDTMHIVKKFVTWYYSQN